MPEFKSWRSYDDFAKSVRTELRYVRSPAADEFLETLPATGSSREVRMKAGAKLWRAQLGQDVRTVYRTVEESNEEIEIEEEEDAPHAPSRMKPIPNWLVEGRANPRGIPYLYLATKRATALAEVRPWVGSRVSLGIFEMVRDLRLVDCARNITDFIFFFEEPAPAERERAVWSAIDRAFARPVERSDDVADYVPTQIIAELFKRNGYDGIAYKSAFGENGYNVALFEVAAANLTYCELQEVTGIEFKFDQRRGHVGWLLHAFGGLGSRPRMRGVAGGNEQVCGRSARAAFEYRLSHGTDG